MARTVVVDASVVVKWYLKETWRTESLSLRDSYIEGKINLAAPSLMPFEVLNAIRYSRKELKPEVLEGIAESLSLYGIKYYELGGDYAKEVVRLSIKNNITVYDASYLMLAKDLKTVLYTADEKLIASLSEEDKKYIQHIKSFSR